jgi:hypothetical protein
MMDMIRLDTGFGSEKYYIRDTGTSLVDVEKIPALAI